MLVSHAFAARRCVLRKPLRCYKQRSEIIEKVDIISDQRGQDALFNAILRT